MITLFLLLSVFIAIGMKANRLHGYTYVYMGLAIFLYVFYAYIVPQ